LKAYLGLGSNVGSRESYLRRAVRLLTEEQGIEAVRTSSLYRTAPWGYEDQDWFLNAVIEIYTSRSPRELLMIAKDIEKRLHRTGMVRWGPRTIDIDILVYGTRVVDECDLQIPHRYLPERAFVLVPLAEIAPFLTVYVREKDAVFTVSQLLDELTDDRDVRLFAPPIIGPGGGDLYCLK